LADDIPFRLALGRRALTWAQRRSWRESYEELLSGYASVAGPILVQQRVAA
jgi:hypothetical protein